MSALSVPAVSEQEYLEIDRLSEVRNEFIEGTVVAMSGASVSHIVIAGNLMVELGGRLRGKECRVMTHDLRVKVELTGDYYYPDLVGICEPARYDDVNPATLLNPTLIIEVLSPSTEGYDRGAKFLHYQQIGSLREYALVAQEEQRVELYARGSEAQWVYQVFQGKEAVARFGSIDCSVALSEIYRGVDFAEMGRV